MARNTMDRQIITSSELRPPNEILSPGVQAGRFLFTSGQLGVDRAGKIVPGGFEAEARQTLDNLRSVLAAGGMTFDDLVKVAIFLKDMNDFQPFNEIYKGYFSSAERPARSCVVVKDLARGARVEVEGIAFK